MKLAGAVLLALLFRAVPSASAEEKVAGPILDSISQAAIEAGSEEEKEIYRTAIRINDLWNNHDLEGFLNGFEKSPDLMVIVDAEKFLGWDFFASSYRRGFPDRSTMEFISIDHVRIQMVTSNIGLALMDYTVGGKSSRKEYGVAMITYKKINESWLIIAAHTSFIPI